MVCSDLLTIEIISCKKYLPKFLEYEDYFYSNLDEEGGTWAPILLFGPEQIAIPIPKDAGSTSY